MYYGELTKDQALEEMKAGKKVANQYFTQGEYLHVVDGVITSEDGYDFSTWFNVIRRGEEWKLSGWRIWQAE